MVDTANISALSNSTQLLLEEIAINVLEQHCPFLWNSSHSCNYDFMAQYVPGGSENVVEEVAKFSKRVQSLSVDEEFLKRMQLNRSVGSTAYYTLITLYTVLIVCGTLGNGLVVTTVLKKASMRTARNLFILNLAVSDLLLCVVTSPSTLMEILSRYWPLGPDTEILCKLVGGSQGVCVFVSSMSIAAIALDRYQVLLYPTHRSLQLAEVGIIQICIWSLAILMSSPMFIIRQLDSHQISQAPPGLPNSIHYCIENWSTKNGRLFYSLFSMLCQYVVPIVTVSITYCRITRQLRSRMRSTLARSSLNHRTRETRARRTNQLLISIAVIYAISWMPLNVYNLLSDLVDKWNNHFERMRIVYAVCHMMAMSSACSNPVLYGWLNENFRKEFVEVGGRLMKCLVCFRQDPSDNVNLRPIRPQTRTIAFSVRDNKTTENTLITKQENNV